MFNHGWNLIGQDFLNKAMVPTAGDIESHRQPGVLNSAEESSKKYPAAHPRNPWLIFHFLPEFLKARQGFRVYLEFQKRGQFFLD